jgi:hypothetical protein
MACTIPVSGRSAKASRSSRLEIPLMERDAFQPSGPGASEKSACGHTEARTEIRGEVSAKLAAGVPAFAKATAGAP